MLCRNTSDPIFVITRKVGKRGIGGDDVLAIQQDATHLCCPPDIVGGRSDFAGPDLAGNTPHYDPRRLQTLHPADNSSASRIQ